MIESKRVHFGIFTFDRATRELWRDGVPVRLQAQPAQALALLIEHAGDVVTRETLRKELWGEETFVDFERGLNFCIAQIRTALGDSAESPRFVRTLPKRGYRFIAPVAQSPQPGPPQPGPPQPGPPQGSPVEPVVVSPRSGRRFLGAAAMVGIALAGGILWWTLRPKASQSAITIAVTRFDNETGDPAFNRLADILTDSVVGELTVAGGGRYGVIGNASVLRGPRESRNLLAIGSALKAGYIAIGQVQRDGASIRILAHLIRLPDQKHLWVVREESSAQEAEGRQSDLARRIAAEFSRRLEADRPRPAASSAAVTR
jgi:DNA-binding winged helix-turn-helix (wHTH) protein/TolB-like protein